jgi:hypothetical protein
LSASNRQGEAVIAFITLTSRQKSRKNLPAIAASAASATACATTAISTAATSAATARTAARASLVNLDSAALQIGVIEGLDCGGRVSRLDHLDESKTARLPRELVCHHNRALDFTRLTKQLCQVLLSNRVGEIAYIQLSGHKKQRSLCISRAAPIQTILRILPWMNEEGGVRAFAYSSENKDRHGAMHCKDRVFASGICSGVGAERC